VEPLDFDLGSMGTLARCTIQKKKLQLKLLCEYGVEVSFAARTFNLLAAEILWRLQDHTGFHGLLLVVLPLDNSAPARVFSYRR
jgi:hypothetical protein